MIPKVIHYCWFGKGKLSPLMEDCITSWKKTNPDFEIRKWDEDTFDVTSHPFANRMYKEKKWAFVSDYARLVILEKHGGFYLDIDMLLLQSLDTCTAYPCVVGEEDHGILNAAFFGAEKNHPYVEACRAYYDTNPKQLETIPVIMSRIYNNLPRVVKESVHVYRSEVFYPFSQKHIHKYHGQDLGENVLGVHLWNYSWGHPLNRLFKKIGVYHFGKKVVEVLGIKKILKKLLGFI